MSDRYVIGEYIAPLHKGRLYAGKDSSLLRPVLVYAVPLHEGCSASAYIQTLGEAAQASSDLPWLHLLDAESDSSNVYVILSYKAGCSFPTFTSQYRLSLYEALDLIVPFGEALQETWEKLKLDVSLEPGNIWITDDGVMNAVCAWEPPQDARHRTSKGLARLLFMLLSRSSQAPSDTSSLEVMIGGALQGQPRAAKDAITTAIINAWNERMPLDSFVRFLRSLQHGAARTGQTAVHGEAARVSPVHTAAIGAADDETAAAYGSFSESKLGRFWKIAVWIGVGLAAVIVLLMILLGKSGDHLQTAQKPADLGTAATQQKESEGTSQAGANRQTTEKSSGQQPTGQQSAPASANQRPKPQEQSKPPQETPNQAQEQPRSGQSASEPPVTQQPAPVQEPDEPTEGPIVQTPALVGLTQEAAEKLAIATGVRYMYYLEFNEETQGIVFKQEPAPDTEVVKGTRIYFWVSKGPGAR